MPASLAGRLEQAGRRATPQRCSFASAAERIWIVLTPWIRDTVPAAMADRVRWAGALFRDRPTGRMAATGAL
ncbi:hypothetical protein HC031_24885 [Planosporangium thailandense]|uniref:Transposase n=1 Tax=Planosporangium thailandense TaxID=765197 RepID=A0ABX0Y680_9ACTN|nr:hypothetical protein [Planosporangium thailandense]NJC72927.1 hypothetical protein [Planosporangium thailandense]